MEIAMLNKENTVVNEYLDIQNRTNIVNLSKLYYRISKELEG